jgi:hypothetical protein
MNAKDYMKLIKFYEKAMIHDLTQTIDKFLPEPFINWIKYDR